MDSKTLQTLEYPKILERLAGYTAFAISGDKARALRPTTDLAEARRLLSETGEAVYLLDAQDNLTIGGARDVREAVERAERGGVLEPTDLLDVKSTLIAARALKRSFERTESQTPNLAAIAAQLPPPLGLIDAITRAISDRGEILDSASDKLGGIRRDLRIAHDRLLTKMQRMVSDSQISPYLQEALVTQRDGRYVLPLRAEFKGKVKAIVHDQSSSGATLFIEPLSVVDLNNEYRELQLAERDEERRVLAALSDQVGANADEISATVELVAELDLAFARGKYAVDLHASEPQLHAVQPKEETRHPGSVIRLYQARHPLLPPDTVVPIDLDLDADTYALVITGPNTGGKTVTLKTVGLFALMAQSGMHIPAQSGSEISLFEGIYADIGDEQSIEQSLSTFSGHVTNIVHILARADRRSLVILDELGAGTDPQEGAALAQAILTHLLERGITTLVATHYPELKSYAHAMPGVVNASAEFDLETLQPTYHLTIGLPGRSNALSIAQRLGLGEEIIDLARQGIDPEDLRAEDLLDEIHRQRDLSREARAAAEDARHNAEKLRAELAERLDQIEDERREVLEDARREAQEQVAALQNEIRAVRQALSRARQPLEVLSAAEESTEELEEAVAVPVARRAPEMPQDEQQPEKTLRRPVRLGDKVRLRGLDTQGVVTSLGEEEAEVQVGQLRVRTRIAELAPIAGGSSEEAGTNRRKKRAAPAASHLAAKVQSPGMELDLRGQRADEALDSLDRYLDSAYLTGMPFVRIIHGKGTGKLRQVVREALGSHPQVKSYESGQPAEGGDGVTVVKLKPV